MPRYLWGKKVHRSVWNLGKKNRCNRRELKGEGQNALEKEEKIPSQNFPRKVNRAFLRALWKGKKDAADTGRRENSDHLPTEKRKDSCCPHRFGGREDPCLSLRRKKEAGPQKRGRGHLTAAEEGRVFLRVLLGKEER